MGPEPCRRKALPLIGVFAFLLVLGAALVLSAEDVSANRLWVPNQYATIQQAVDNATPGDEVIIYAGLYNESVKVITPIELRGAGDGETIITSDEEQVLRLEGTRITVSSLTIIGIPSNYGIHCNQFSDGLLKNVKVRNCTTGILLTATYESIIMISTVEDCGVGVMVTNGSYDNQFEQVSFLNNMVGLDIGRNKYPIDDSGNYFAICVFESNHYGARVASNGIRNTFYNCRFAYNDGTALILGGADCLVDKCVFFDNNLRGITLYKPGTITNSTVDYHGLYGIEIWDTGGCNLTNISLDNNQVGVYLRKAHETTLSKLYASNNFDGIHLSDGSYDVTVSESEIINSSRIAITVDLQCDDIIVVSCNFAKNDNGMLISKSKNVQVSECTFSSNKYVGIRGVDSNNIDIRRSSIILTTHGHGIELSGCRATNIVDCISNNNSRSGISVTSWDYQGPSEKGISDCRINGNDESGILLDRVSGFTIVGTTVENNGAGGIHASATLRSTVMDNKVHGNAFGIALNESQNCLLSNNSVRQNDQEGIRLISSGSGNGNEILDNSIVENSWQSSTNRSGILLSGQYTQNNIIARNSILSNPIGIRFESYTDGCENNQVYQNTIRNCQFYGIGTKWSAGPNSIYLNAFISNAKHVNGVHTRDSYFKDRLGNYWDDYKERYPNEVRTGAIWNRPYEVESGTNIFDNFPLAFIYETDPPEVFLHVDESVTFGDHILLDAAGTRDPSWFGSFTWIISDSSNNIVTRTTQTYFHHYTPTVLWEHTVLLIVEDTWGNSAEATGVFTVIDETAPIVHAGADLVVDVGEAFELNINSLEENHRVSSIDWIVDPGGLDILLHGSEVTLTIDRVGTFTVNLTVSDVSGNVGKDSIIVYVLDRVPPIAVAGPAVGVGIHQRVAFDGSRSVDNVGIVKYTWSFRYDDWDHELDGARIGFVFAIPGKYTVMLKVEDASGNVAKDTLEVTVRDTEPPVADAGEDVFVNQGDLVILTSSGSSDNIGITRIQWQLYESEGSGTRWESIASIYFDKVGEYTVTLFVYDAEDNWASDTVTVTVWDTQSPEAVASLPETLLIGTNILLDGSYSSDNVEVVGYHWTVKFAGKRKTLTGQMAEFSFASAGHYEITLTVRDSAGNEASDTVRIVVTAAESEVPETAAWVIPSMAVVLIAVLIAGLIIGPRVLKRKE